MNNINFIDINKDGIKLSGCNTFLIVSLLGLGVVILCWKVEHLATVMGGLTNFVLALKS